MSRAGRPARLKIAGLASATVLAACSDGTGPGVVPPDALLIERDSVDAFGDSYPGGLWLVDASGRLTRNIVPASYGARDGEWSADGNTILFQGFFFNRNFTSLDSVRVCRVPVSTGSVTCGNTPASGFTRWVGADRIGYVAQGALKSVRQDGTDVRDHIPAAASVQMGEWSPDATRIAYSARYTRSTLTLWLANSDGSNVTSPLVSAGLNSLIALYPTWSPDGRYVAFEGTLPADGQSDIYLLTVATGEVRRLTTTNDTDKDPGWSNDNQRVFFYRHIVNGPRTLNAVTLNGIVTQVLAENNREYWHPRMRPHS